MKWTSKNQRFYTDNEYLVVSASGNVMSGKLVASDPRRHLIALEVKPVCDDEAAKEVKPSNPGVELLKKVNESHGQ